jgi:hypothetical protein
MILGEGFADRAASGRHPRRDGRDPAGAGTDPDGEPEGEGVAVAPTWPNHPSIIKYLGMPMAEYRYFDVRPRASTSPG